MSLTERILKNSDKPIKESFDEEFASITQEELSDVQNIVDKIVIDSKAYPFYSVMVKPFETGFKLEVIPNESGLTNLLNGLSSVLSRDLGWEEVRTEDGQDGKVTVYFD